MGTRVTDNKRKAGPYTWMTYAQVIAHGQKACRVLDLKIERCMVVRVGSRNSHTPWLRFTASRRQTWCDCRIVLSQSYRYVNDKFSENALKPTQCFRHCPSCLAEPTCTHGWVPWSCPQTVLCKCLNCILLHASCGVHAAACILDSCCTITSRKVGCMPSPVCAAGWVLVDAACTAYSMTSVPLYDTLGPEAVTYICGHAELTVVACSVDVLDTLLTALPQCPTVKIVVCTSTLHLPNLTQCRSPLQHWWHHALTLHMAPDESPHWQATHVTFVCTAALLGFHVLPCT